MSAQQMDFKSLYLSIDGRINRRVYWLRFAVPVLLISIILQAVDDIANTGGALFIIFSLLIIWPSIAVSVKRCHDRDSSGWFLLVGIIPFINIWVLIELYFLKGTTGSNKYGDDPLS